MKVDKLYIDISPTISSKTAVFPGDVSFKQSVHLSVDSGDHIGLSSIETTLHIGAHADAPSHYGPGQASVHEMDLSAYMGLVQVIHVDKAKAERIKPEDIAEVKINAPRVLFCTNSYTDPHLWNENFNSLSPELIGQLNKAGVVLVGLDTPSVDPADSKKLESHKALLEYGMRVLEGLVLNHVQPGLYQLLALPLPIENGDASPVRAILLPPDVDLSQH